MRLAGELDSGKYAIVLVGLSERRIKEFSEQLVALPKTESREKLVEAYSAADVFFNSTVEDNYPTVNLEAEACGTPVVTYDTGGCRETVKDNRSIVVEGYADAVRFLEALGGVKR